MRTITILFVLIAACAGRHESATPILSAPVTLAFANVRIFDGEHTIPRGTVLVAGGRIAGVGADLSIPPGTRTIDGTGKTLLPGLIDAHTHSYLLDALAQAPGLRCDHRAGHVRRDPRRMAELKRQIASEPSPVHADLRSAGFAATVPGGHGTEYPFPVPTLANAAAARAWVEARVAEGSDYIKIIYDSGEAYGLVIPTLESATIAALVTAAHAHGKLAVAHIGSAGEARRAIAAGVDGLAHLFLGPAPDADFGVFAATHHVFVVPTLAVLHSFCDGEHGSRLARDPRIARGLSTGALATLEERGPAIAGASCAPAVAAIHQLLGAGCRCWWAPTRPTPGSRTAPASTRSWPCSSMPGSHPHQALTAATAAPARAFHLDNRGDIAVGLRAVLRSGRRRPHARRDRDPGLGRGVEGRSPGSTSPRSWPRAMPSAPPPRQRTKPTPPPWPRAR